ncbi:alpha/beta hydrolase [Jiangella gansuensis]|uniref:alpha/beta hydrolase n=1 Tax=Jiangella gansuensis TaxID=281473 RepID=UPI0004BA3A58|nr:alpha/beta hydrolase [Jiangella gansuensis]
MSGRDVHSRAAHSPDLTVTYGPLPDHVADVWLPVGDDARPRTAMLLVMHGGFWRAEYDRRHARPQCAALAAAGYVVVSIEYRRVGAGGGWPATFDDVALAVDTVPGQVGAAARRSGRPAGSAPPRAVLVGHSAGGHLAVWAASRHRLPAGSPWRLPAPAPAVAGVVSLAGVLDLTTAAELDLDDGAARTLIGGGPVDQPERYAVADPLRLTPVGVPTVLVHGTADRQVPHAFSRRYATAAGPRTRLVELPGVEHFALIDPASAAWPAVLTAVAHLVDGGRAD